jgi:hypothetical protein
MALKYAQFQETEMAHIGTDVVRPLRAHSHNATSRLKAVAAETAGGRDAEGLIDSLREQIGALAAGLEHFAEERYEQARATAGSVADAGSIVAARAGRQTLATAQAIRRDPLPALVAVGVLSLLIALFMGTMKRR